MTEMELNVLARQCLSRWINEIELLRKELTAWETERSQNKSKILWHFRTRDAKEKLISLYLVFTISSPQRGRSL